MLWGGDLGEANAQIAKDRVGVPESIFTAKIGHARIDAHASAGGDDECITSALVLLRLELCRS